MTLYSKSPVAIIGMHRSGTSLLARVLDRSGVLMGRDHTAHYESNFFQRLNIQLLRRHQADWDRPVATSETPEGFHLRGLMSEYASLLKHPTGWWPLLRKRGWGWKDPRNTFTLGSWLNVFPNLHALHIYRNGVDVARSLYVRNAMLQPGTKWHRPALADLHSCFELWEQYALQAAAWKNELGPRYLSIRYEDLVTLNPQTIEKLEDFTGRNLRAALALLVDKERARKRAPLEELDHLKQRVRSNQTLSRLGYVVE